MDLRANVTRMPGTGPQGGVDLEPNYYVRDPRGDGIKLPPRGRGQPTRPNIPAWVAAMRLGQISPWAAEIVFLIPVLEFALPLLRRQAC
jgi:hypothetical protein